MMYRARDTARVEELLAKLTQGFHIIDLGELQWFLGMRILRDRKARKLWLVQDTYWETIYLRFNLSEAGKRHYKVPRWRELKEYEGEASAASKKEYLEKIGSLLYGAVTTRPDIAEAASHLSRYSRNPGPIHHDALDEALLYGYHTRHLAIQYGGDEEPNVRSLICSSDASFADNPDRRSSQGFVISLFGGPIVWRANKQDTVTTSSTEAELLALSQTVKEAIFRVCSVDLSGCEAMYLFPTPAHSKL
ncbi:hypothetical protein DL767_010081 [Monosporascus sp. MG133]|nr:hypothetical protein DL767_010081 [Monosporascus sp. MG133]